MVCIVLLDIFCKTCINLTKQSMCLHYVSVPPHIQFELPAVVFIPRHLTVRCEVERAYPNFCMFLRIGKIVTDGPVCGQNKFVTLFSGQVSRNMSFASTRMQTQTFECIVVWMKRYNNESLPVRRLIHFNCK